MAAKGRTGVILFNLGGPETMEQVKPFLFNLFSDPDIIRLPWRGLQKPLAWLISTQRFRKSRGYYAQIGGGSPLRRITEEQAAALERALENRGIPARAYVGMRYWNPSIEDALESMFRDGVENLVVLPLYPQYSISTTGSSLNKMNALLDRGSRRFQSIAVVKDWHQNPEYISAMTSSIMRELAEFPDQDPSKIHLIFSAHSVPVSYIEAGDPYLDQTKRTVQLVMEELAQEIPHSLSFQSKVGPVKWLEPSTDQNVRKVAASGFSQVLLVPISFVSEHIETLYELDILYRGVAREVGLTHYRRVPALNCSEDFIDALAGIVQQSLNGK